MKDTFITAKAKKRELMIFLICLIVAILINVYSIITYGTDWHELYTMAGMVGAISIVLYIVLGIIRLIIRVVLRLIRRFT